MDMVKVWLLCDCCVMLYDEILYGIMCRSMWYCSQCASWSTHWHSEGVIVVSLLCHVVWWNIVWCYVIVQCDIVANVLVGRPMDTVRVCFAISSGVMSWCYVLSYCVVWCEIKLRMMLHCLMWRFVVDRCNSNVNLVVWAISWTL